MSTLASKARATLNSPYIPLSCTHMHANMHTHIHTTYIRKREGKPVDWTSSQEIK